MTIQIRDAVRADAALILGFITELAIFEKAEHEVVATLADIEDSLFADHATARALICSIGGKAVGYAVYFLSYSTWLGRNGLYLEDLYISPEHRGAGAGKFMLGHLACLARDTGCGRFEWSVLDWNEPAIQFYRSIGATAQDEWVRYRIAGDALLHFSDQHSKSLPGNQGL
ncbi:GNAT family N-acetyltransferase [Janthinobacterium sp.]|uniref:GNAT family N-acetyltransferase n=1 Tax=Janthinobacterium sp. TaxID=1871054 RepID=UPI00261895F4|nr:GNAT family N-acetyltransferase [Janthinobacterium sp.]